MSPVVVFLLLDVDSQIGLSNHPRYFCLGFLSVPLVIGQCLCVSPVSGVMSTWFVYLDVLDWDSLKE